MTNLFTATDEDGEFYLTLAKDACYSKHGFRCFLRVGSSIHIPEPNLSNLAPVRVVPKDAVVIEGVTAEDMKHLSENSDFSFNIKCGGTDSKSAKVIMAIRDALYPQLTPPTPAGPKCENFTQGGKATCTCDTLGVWNEVFASRRRADEKHGNKSIGRLKATDARWLSILVEEIGEVANALTYDTSKNIRAELIDVLSVASAWVDALDLINPVVISEGA